METQTLSFTLAGRALTLPVDRIGEGPPALLLPALSSISTREEMRPLATRLSTRHACLVPDWPGFGAQPRARVPLAPDTLHAFLDALLAPHGGAWQAPGPYALGIA
ncbi:alpha/beta fold hydrolase, partial [Methylobacterium ajmalii]|nr:alpha/beta hydrolase [Methylobacterium ajmalii]